MKIKYFVILIALSLIFTVIPGAVMAMKCSCTGTIDFDQTLCPTLGFDYEQGNCIYTNDNVQIQSKAECTQATALEQSGHTGAVAQIICEYSAEVGEACEVKEDCVSGVCENSVCVEAPPAPKTSSGAGTFCACPAATGSDCEKVCQGSGIATGQTGQGCCCKKTNGDFQDCARVANQAECDAKCKATGATADLGTAISAIDTFLGQKIEGQTLGSEMISGSVSEIVGDALKVFLGIVGSLALVIFIFGGIMWMTSGGNPEKIKKAQGTLVWSILGMMVIFLSYVIVSMVITGITHKSDIEQEQQQEQRDLCVEQCKNAGDVAVNFCDEQFSKNEIDEKEHGECFESTRLAERSCRIECQKKYK